MSSGTGSSASSSGSQDATSGSSSNKGEKKHWWSRKSSDKSDDTDPSETFTKLDKDNDGFLSQSELAKDQNKSGK
jgi:hypothetical protein